MSQWTWWFTGSTSAIREDLARIDLVRRHSQEKNNSEGKPATSKVADPDPAKLGIGSPELSIETTSGPDAIIMPSSVPNSALLNTGAQPGLAGDAYLASA